MEQESSESFVPLILSIKHRNNFSFETFEQERMRARNVSFLLVPSFDAFRGRIYGFLKASLRGPYIAGTENPLLEVAWLEMEQKLVKRIARPALLRAASNNNS